MEVVFGTLLILFIIILSAIVNYKLEEKNFKNNLKKNSEKIKELKIMNYYIQEAKSYGRIVDNKSLNEIKEKMNRYKELGGVLKWF